MKRITINENQAALLFKKGKFERILTAGTYCLWGNVTVELFNIGSEIVSDMIDPEDLMNKKGVKDLIEVFAIRENELGIRLVGGNYKDILVPGTHLFFKAARNEVHVHSTREIFATGIVGQYAHRIPTGYLHTVTVLNNFKGILYVNGRIEAELDPGVYYVWAVNKEISVGHVNMSIRTCEVPGQEILTADKVAVRLTFALNYRVTDARGALEATDDYMDQIYTIVQFALRKIVGTQKLDEILEGKDKISETVFAELKEKCGLFCVDVIDGGIRDIILPGAVRDIMSTVLIAEKKAQANVITRREEIASTRSLLNTAKLMEENPTLYRLKELEYIEHIFEKVGNVNIGSGDVLSQLTGMIRRNKDV